MTTCGALRPITDDLLGRGQWVCHLEEGHSGFHEARLGNDSCRWDDEGNAPEGTGLAWLDDEDQA
jgi:hypothetical protein